MTPCGAPVALLTTGLQKPNAKKYALQRWRPSFQSPKPHHQSVQKAVAGSGGVRAHTLVSVVLAMMRGHPCGMNDGVDLQSREISYNKIYMLCETTGDKTS